MSNSCLVLPSFELLAAIDRGYMRAIWKDYRRELLSYAQAERSDNFARSPLDTGQLLAFPVRCRCGLLLPFDYYYSANCGYCMTCRKEVLPGHILDAVRVTRSLEVELDRTWEILVGFFGFPRRF